MHAVAPKEASTSRSKCSKGELIERTYDYVIACHSLKGKISQMKVVEDFDSTPHKAAPSVVERDMEEQVWNEQKMQKALPGFCGGSLPGRSTKERGREEEKPSRLNKEQLGKVSSRTGIARKLRTERTRKLWTGMKKIRWKSNGLRMKKLVDILERRRVDGGSLQAEAMQKEPELVAHECMTQTVKGLVERTVERRSWTSTRWKTAKEERTEAEALPWNGVVCEEAGRKE